MVLCTMINLTVSNHMWLKNTAMAMQNCSMKLGTQKQVRRGKPWPPPWDAFAAPCKQLTVLSKAL